LTAPLLTAMTLSVGACFSTPPRELPDRPVPQAPLAPAPHPPDPDSVPDAIPHVEARSRFGNPPFYEVFGKRYYVLSSNVGYIERGVASWYGPGFHQVRTSTGEPYDMYAMTAAHKTLPLPAYVRVTNLQNGRAVVVRVNDRGPFVSNRIIDLSYTAAAKLDMIRNGTAFVEVRSIDPSGSEAPLVVAAAPAQAPPATPTGSVPTATPAAPPPTAATATPAPTTTPALPVPPVTAGAALFVQAGAFGDPANAQRLAQKLRGGDYGNVFVRDDRIAGRRMYRVRIGPVPNVAEFDRVLAALQREGVSDAHLALD
jgi:rare lipoprotein A